MFAATTRPHRIRHEIIPIHHPISVVTFPRARQCAQAHCFVPPALVFRGVRRGATVTSITALVAIPMSFLHCQQVTCSLSASD
jgi:hypothetical protein